MSSRFFIHFGSLQGFEMSFTIFQNSFSLFASSILLEFSANLSFLIIEVARFLSFLYFSRSRCFSPLVVLISFLILSLSFMMFFVSGFSPATNAGLILKVFIGAQMSILLRNEMMG